MNLKRKIFTSTITTLSLFCLFSCANLVNEKMKFEKPELVNDPTQAKQGYTLQFETNNNEWHSHDFSEREDPVRYGIKKDLNYKKDAIEFTIKGTPTNEFNYLQIYTKDSDWNSLIFAETHETFSAGVPFEYTCIGTLTKNFNKNDLHHSGIGLNCNSNIQINDFSITAKTLKDCGFIIPNGWRDLSVSNVITSEEDDSNYFNLTLSGNASEDLPALIIKLHENNNEHEYFIGKIDKGFNNIQVSFDIRKDLPTTYTNWSYYNKKLDQLDWVSLSYNRGDTENDFVFTDFEINGSFSRNQTYKTNTFYTFEGNTLTIEDDSAFYGVDSNKNFWQKHDISASQVHSIIINNGVTYIPENAFINHECKEIVVPASVTTIELKALYHKTEEGTRSQENVSCVLLDWPSTDETERNISNEMNNSNCCAVIYNDGVIFTRNYEKTFSWFNKDSVTLYLFATENDNTITQIVSNNWSSNDIKNIVFMEGCEKISINTNVSHNISSVLNGFDNLQTIKLPSTLKEIEAVFANIKISSITIPSSVTKIEAKAFEFWDSKQTINLDWSSTDDTFRSFGSKWAGTAKVYYNDNVEYNTNGAGNNSSSPL